MATLAAPVVGWFSDWESLLQSCSSHVHSHGQLNAFMTAQTWCVCSSLAEVHQARHHHMAPEVSCSHTSSSMIGYTQSLLIQAGVCAATMEALFDTGQGHYGPNFAPDFLLQYWALMAGHLTTLKLVIGTAFTEHKSMALNHLTRLLCLVLAAADQEPIAIDVPGNII